MLEATLLEIRKQTEQEHACEHYAGAWEYLSLVVHAIELSLFEISLCAEKTHSQLVGHGACRHRQAAETWYGV